MKKYLLICLAGATMSGPVLARNMEYKLNFSDVLASVEAKAKLDQSVTFRFGENTTPDGAQRKGDRVIKRAGKGEDRNDDLVACDRAALSALVFLQQEAKKVSADAVVEIVSYYKNIVFSSSTSFECHAGNGGATVVLKAVYVTLPK